MPSTSQNLQNLFCSLTWCLRTLSPPLGSGNEVLLHPPLPVGQILWLKNIIQNRVSLESLSKSLHKRYTNGCHCALNIFMRLLSGKMWSCSPCGWLTNVVTQKLGILAISSDLFWKNGWRSLLYFCSTLRISSLACSFNLKRNNLSQK